ncbi:MAG: hypothetical protein J6V71_01295, partial [Clostridia bacterium]|nr:hypothetical protein [Clostridia bacterium]
MKTIGKKLKAIYLMAVIALVSICMSFIPLMTNTVKADVEPSPTTGLRIIGAQVKTLDGYVHDEYSQFAVYFHTEITEEFYNSIKTGDNNVQFGMLVGPRTMVNSFSSYNAIEVADFDEAVGQVVTDGNLTNVNKAANFRFVGDDLLDAIEFTNGVKTFEAGVVFDEQSLVQSGFENVLKLAAATKLTAIPYYVVDGLATMNVLDAKTRTAKDILVETKVRIANNTSNSNLDETIINLLLNKYVGEVELMDSECYFEKTTNKFYVADVENKLVAWEDTGLADVTEFSFAGVPSDEVNIADIEDGSIVSSSFTLENGNVKVFSTKVVTKVLATLEDFFVDADESGAVEAVEMTRDNYIFNLKPQGNSGAALPSIAIKGYYVLANNIDLNNNTALCNRSTTSGDHTVQVWDGSSDTGFQATLDGRGFALKNISASGSSAGMFGAFFKATVKNIAFDGATNSAGNGSGLVLGYSYNSTFENVYIRLVGNNGGDTWAGEGS